MVSVMSFKYVRVFLRIYNVAIFLLDRAKSCMEPIIRNLCCFDGNIIRQQGIERKLPFLSRDGQRRIKMNDLSGSMNIAVRAG